MPNAKWMDLNEFREAGYLQEVNRRFFHPLGLALAVDADDDGKVSGLAGIYDDRDDPEGWIYNRLLDPEKAANIDRQFEERARPRVERLGFLIQPVPAGEDDSGSASHALTPPDLPE